MDTASLAATDHPAGTVTLAMVLEAVVGPVLGGLTRGLGDPPGDGLGSPDVTPPLTVTVPRLPMTASSVPQPAMTMTSPTTPAMIIIQGVRWTGAWGTAGT
jgi:hypothetical protein